MTTSDDDKKYIMDSLNVSLDEEENSTGIYFSSEADIESGNGDTFLSIMFANFLLAYRPTNQYDSILRDMASKLADNIYHRPWVAEYSLRTDEFKKDNPENKFVMPRNVFSQEEIVQFGRSTLGLLPKRFPIGKSAGLLADMLDLGPVETLFLQLSLKVSSSLSYDFMTLLESFRFSDFGDTPTKLFAELFGVGEDAVRTAMKGFLFRSGMLDQQETRLKPFYYINAEMREAFCATHLSVESLTESLFPSNIQTELSLKDFPHLVENLERVEKIINKGLVEKKRGINLMLWGIPGTGKTEMAVLLAKRNKWKLRIIGDISDADNREKSRAERLVSLKIALKLYGRDPNTVLLFDEMEDIFKTDNHAEFSKAFINRIIETTTVPIIWTTNDLEVCGEAVLRRMIYNVAFEVPPIFARKTIWSRYLKKYKLKLDKETLDDLAETYDTAPALIHNATKITSMAGLEASELPEVVKSLDRLINFGVKRKFEPRTRAAAVYDLSCVNTTTDLIRLTDRLCECRTDFSLLLYGPPGTGKSEYGRYVAGRLHKRLLYKRASDLLSKYVGESEANIAEAFEQAKHEEALLLIDEGDTFLRDREGAERSWEVTQVNEFLSQMERHTQPLIMTTNLMRHLDPAAMRRFTFKMMFDYLLPEQSEKLFKRYFGVNAPIGLARMETLTPGDLAVVKRRSDITGESDPIRLLEMLTEECAVKRQKAVKMGF